MNMCEWVFRRRLEIVEHAMRALAKNLKDLEEHYPNRLDPWQKELFVLGERMGTLHKSLRDLEVMFDSLEKESKTTELTFVDTVKTPNY